MSVSKQIEYVTYPKTKGQEFGDPTWVKFGKKERIQDHINAAKTDTEIYECLEKYGCLKPLELNIQAVYGDFTEYNDLRGSLEKIQKAKDMWKLVPAEVKKEFNNDIHEFTDRGFEWVKKRIEAEKAQAQTAQKQETEIKTEA